MSPRDLHLTVRQPDGQPAVIDIPATSEPITLGRATDCTIPIKDRFLSRRHAEIVYASGEWFVRDCGSANGTMLNGVKLSGTPAVLRAGDRISLGDSEVIFGVDPGKSQIFAVDSDSQATQLSMHMQEAIAEGGDRAGERAAVLSELAVEFIEERPASALFDFILDKVVALLSPSRAALALLGADGRTFADVLLRRRSAQDEADLRISSTLLEQVIQNRNVVAFFDTFDDSRLARAESIVAQQIRSAVCAPLLVGDAVLGVLYLDFLARGSITPDDVRLIAQIARFAAVKLETTRLREESLAKAKFEEELRTAYAIQSRLLPATLPSIDGFEFAGTSKPCRTVSGDYYDVIARPDGRIYFVIADVSGKGITAALVMSSLATAFSIFVASDPAPSQLVSSLNATLAPKTAPTKFATLFAGVLDPKSGRVDFTNAGHVPPLVISRGGVTELKTTDMVVGLFPTAKYRDQSLTLAPGDSLVLFTDGVTEAENEVEEQLGIEPVKTLATTLHCTPAAEILSHIDRHVHTFAGNAPAGDDVTMLALTRRA